ncbi:HD domain-containing protein [Desulfovibrio sp. TomC]|uniref:HD domain-containing protein n=1 Tax=Desulfovibrio sp. TomC TaxID=1562888 RepID=UPI000574AECC|nr:HD domain-containing protein [Desulfovibrio sp. TomC]KHK03584.1 HD domain protein [Desulfovibrio sp. TomC]
MSETCVSVETWFAAFFAGHGVPTATDAVRMELKRFHCERVRDEALALAGNLGLSQRHRTLAAVAGLCHDVGRFPQYQRYRTFSDRQSVNHAILGVQTLNRHGALAGLPRRDRTLVRTAIVAHNRHSLPPALASGGDQEALTLARIIRDADKLDIVRVMLDHFNTPGEKDPVVFLGQPDLPGQYNPVMLETVTAGRLGSYADMTSLNDFALLLLSWINDMAFPWTRQQFFARGHVQALFAQLPEQPQLAIFKKRYFEYYAPTSF